LSRPYSRKGTRSFGEELGPKPKKRALENVCTKLQKAEKLQKNPGTTVGVSSNIRRPKINEKVYRDYETTGEKNFPPPWGKTAGAEQGKEFLL